MGNLPFFQGTEENEEEAEQQALDKWRPQCEQPHVALKRRKLSSKSSESDDSGSQGATDSESVASSASKEGSLASEEDGSGKGEDDDKKSDASRDEDDISSQEGSEDQQDADALAKKGDQKRKKKEVVRMEFEPLLALHEPLASVIEEPADIFAAGKSKGKATKADQAAIDEAAAECRRKASEAVAYFNATHGDDPYAVCPLRELAAAIGEDPDELRYALEQSARFTVDEDGNVHKTLLQQVFDAMNNDIETKDEVVNKLLDSLGRDFRDRTTLEESIVVAARDSGGQLRIKTAKDVELYEQVDIEAEEALMRQEKREERQRMKEEKKKLKKRGKYTGDDEDEDSSSSEEDGITSMNKEAEKKALAFRRIQVQRKIEEFLKAYTKGQNLVKINAKGKRYHRRVYVDTTKRALVVQGATGPKFFPFASMREVDIETRTTKEGRVETLVICAIEKGGRIVKELNLAFPDQAKANTFVNCVTLFALALRNGPKK